MRLIAVLLIGFLGALPVLALDLEPTVPAVNTLIVTDLSSNLTDLSQFKQTNVAVLRFTITNNDKDSFKVEISSVNNGKYFHSTGGGTAAKQVSYTIKIIDTGSGTLGSTAPGLPTAHNLSSASLITLTFSAATTGTENRVFEIQISTAAAQPQLLSGTYSDTFTVSLIDL